MAKKLLNIEYAELMLQAEEAVGRKEAVGLLHKAYRIRKKIYRQEAESSQLESK
ncbi:MULTISPECIES: hypothetical protein [Prochlorococcus]|uniref:hypothetical protein n=1 Tax=Prochlorococcus TaxID=1218 RepID=UPI0005337D30|nr:MULTISPECIES: hypothetical protein [Prochlorococcus]KGG12793.1 hypothetical protein EV05_0464 [Prochlorococcus sp. MIT 0601]